MLAIFQADSEDKARQIVDLDPAVRGGVFVAQVYPYFVALLGDAEPFRPKE